MIQVKRPIAEREELIKAFVNNEISKEKTAKLLGCCLKTVANYAKAYTVNGVNGLIDHRHSNHCKLNKKQKRSVVDLKKKDRWRSARNIRDYLRLPVHRNTVSTILSQAGLNKENLKRVKAITRFEASCPNEMWQTDIMGKINFPKAGPGYLIGTLDDYSRFVPDGYWYNKQGKMNVFQVWYRSLVKCGLPDKMLQDEGSQYKARVKFGQADYQWYAKQLEIVLIWAKRAETKGKIERFWKFVQGDFVPSVWKAKNLEIVNRHFKVWLANYNYRFRSNYFNGKTRAERYQPSKRRVKRVELETLLLIEERRKVTRQSTISLYGQHYYVPPGYIGCRIWVKIKGDKILFEANGKIIHKTKLRL